MSNKSSAAGALIDLCVKYIEYLAEGGGGSSSAELCDALENYNLPLHAKALLQYFEEGDCVGDFSLPSPWENSSCYLTTYPPGSPRVGDVWFDPFELSFMVRTVNPQGFGRATIGWVSIGPVYYWQYHAFQQLVKYEKNDAYFECRPDLLASRPFGVEESDVATEIYYAEAAAYALWHGKWLTSSLRADALVQVFSKEKSHQVFPQGMYFWDTLPGDGEPDRSVYSVVNGSDVRRYSLDEWGRSNKLGLLTSLSDQSGLISTEFIPRDAGEYIKLLNCSRKVMVN